MSENIKSSNTITADTIVQQIGNTKVEIKPGEIIINTESQLDRVEKKVDRIIELLEDKELSTFNLQAKSMKL